MPRLSDFPGGSGGGLRLPLQGGLDCPCGGVMQLKSVSSFHYFLS